jgi:hypothetical protein
MADHSHVRARLLKEYSPNTQGTWEIRGEDPNCDLGGHHHEPKLEVVTGTYKNVVEYALTLPNFFQWGSGGRIIRMDPPADIINVDNMRNPRVVELEDERRDLHARLKEIESELQTLLRKK